MKNLVLCGGFLFALNACEFLNGEMSEGTADADGNPVNAQNSPGTKKKNPTGTGDDLGDFVPPFGAGGSTLSVASFDRGLQNYFINQDMTISASVLYAAAGNISFEWSHSLNGTTGACTLVSTATSEDYVIRCPSAGSLSVSLKVKDSAGAVATKTYTFANSIKTTAVATATFAQAKAVLQSNCAMSCHNGNGQGNNWQLGSASAATDFPNSGEISKGDAERSAILVKMTGFGKAGGMPKGGGQLSDDSVATIVRWIDSL